MITMFWLWVAVFVLLATSIIFWHFLRTKPVDHAVPEQSREQENLNLYKRRLAELECDLAEERIDQASYDELKIEIDKTLLQDIEQDEKTQYRTGRPSWLWPIALLLFVSGFSVLFYLKQPGYHEFQAAINAPAADPHSQQDKAEIERIQQLETIVKAEPENARAWYTLAQSYIMVGAYEKSLAAYDRVIAIEGEMADLYGSKAQALYYQNGQQLTAEVQAMVDKALSLDPLDASTLVLLGMHNYLAQDFTKAVTYWQQVVDSDRPNVNKEALQQAIDEARSLMTEMGQAPVVTDGPSLTLAITLSDSAISALNEGPDRVVFVYATPADGRRMPLAVVKLMASDLPTTVQLTNAQAMSPQANLSSVESVNLYAVVSMDGNVGIKPGDLVASKEAVAVTQQAVIELEISQQ